MRYCEEYTALLDLYVDGELNAEDMVRVQAHLDECPACQAYVDDALAIRAAFPDVEDTVVPDGFTDGVMARIQADTVSERKKTAPWAKVLLPLAACCAIVILLQNSGIFSGRAEEAVKAEAPAAAMDTSVSQATTESAAEYAEPAEGDPQIRADLGGASPDEPVSDKASVETAAPEESKSVNMEAGTTVEMAPLSDGWVEYDNIVFSAVVFLSPNDVGDALDGYEGKPYSNANLPDEGVIGTGYALERETFERILYEELNDLLGPMENQQRTTELCCIVVTENETFL